MWTPKRVLLLAFGFVTFCAAYVAYAQVLGGIDGLPALPAKYYQRGGGGGMIEPPMVTQVEERLQQAFGSGCRELKMLIQVESPHGVVIASKDCVFVPGGREIRLTPASLAFFSKPVANRDPEINTIRGATATLFLDQPISGVGDIGKRRIVAAELYGAQKKENDPNGKDEPIEIRNNRHTLRRGDDLVIIIPNGPLYFDDDKRLIHTKDVVTLRDLQSQPIPTQVTATGLEVHLAPNVQTGPGGGKAAGGKPRPEGAGPVERIVLRADVDMHLYSEPGSSFLNLGSTPRPAVPAKPGAAPAAKDEIHITTGGPFVYDLPRNWGRFDIPDKPSPFFPEHVCVVRNPDPPGEVSKEDKLKCEHLELQFQRKATRPAQAGTPPAANDDPGANLEIEWAHAWGGEVTIKSVAEKLDAAGNDLYYRAPTRTTILKGEPQAKLVKDGDLICARELELIDQRDPRGGGSQQVTASGPGNIHLADKKTKKLTQHARWSKKFKSERVGSQDVLTFEGDAAFVEDDQLRPEDVRADDRLLACKTFLKADELQVLLDPPPQEAPAAAAPAAKPAAPRPGELPAEGGGRRPRRLDAIGHVVARSPEIHILVPPPELRQSSPGTQRLTLYFKDLPDAPLPAPVAVKPADPLSQPGPEPIVVPAAPAKPEPPPKPSPPVQLSARTIIAHINRSSPSGKTELDRLETEGEVYVVKEPSGDDKGFSVKGEKLDLKRKPTGSNLLHVTGDLARLRMDQLTITGPEVDIDQGDNTATVNGDGFMEMENKTDFAGNSLTKPEVLTVYWNKLMRFDGNFAEFHGGIHAEQGTSRLRCQTLKVEFDKPISLSDQHREKKDPGPANEPARAKKLLCDRSVAVEKEEYDPKTGRLLGYRSLSCLELMVENLERKMSAPGPGVVRIVQPGGAGTALGGAPPKAATRPATKPAEPEWALTIVTYGRFGDALGQNEQGGGRMDADNNKHTAVFWEDVRVLHLPWTADPKRLREPVDIGDTLEKGLPAGALYMECRDQLRVYSPEEAAPKAAGQDPGTGKHVMTGVGQVYLKSTDAKRQVFWGVAEEVHYDEEKGQVIFDGKGGLAEVYQVERRGDQPKKTMAKTITYWLKTGEVKVDQATQISGGTGRP